jgi:hypothetical protein
MDRAAKIRNKYFDGGAIFFNSIRASKQNLDSFSNNEAWLDWKIDVSVEEKMTVDRISVTGRMR